MKRTELQNLQHAFQGAAPTAKAIQKVGWACGSVSVFSSSDFKAKAFRFCHFFCPQNVILSKVRSTESKDPVKVHYGFFGHSGLRMTTNTSGNVIRF
ncbi:MULTISPECIES: hypothetical protein [unclassified Fibrobacter]|uniref:hypothetical protein n=1 Tax=unclassified Fibrobacter TaxID=2634177 RepID=UPI000D6C8C14|nr:MULTISPECIES: hypothetical protein [unclassified Fibrobacter]